MYALDAPALNDDVVLDGNVAVDDNAVLDGNEPLILLDDDVVPDEELSLDVDDETREVDKVEDEDKLDDEDKDVLAGVLEAMDEEEPEEAHVGGVVVSLKTLIELTSQNLYWLAFSKHVPWDDLPIIVTFWMSSNLGLARLPLGFAAWERQWATSVAVNTVGTGPRATESCGENNPVLFEVTGDITSRKERVGCAEIGHIRCAAGQALGFRTTRKEPGLDESIGPLHGICSSIASVERITEIGI